MRTLCALPIECVEVFFNCATETKPLFAKELRRIADDGGVSVVSVHPYTSGMEPMLFFTNYERRFQEGMESYRRYYEAANILGAGIVVFHGGVRGLDMPRQEYFERYGRLLEDAKKHGVSLCHENVTRCIGYEPGFFEDMAKALPDAGFVFDTKQAVRAGFNVYQFAQRMGKNIRHIHLSDHRPGADCLPPGQGVLNISKLLHAIGKIETVGSVAVELYRDNFADIVEIYNGYQHLFGQLSTTT